MLLVLRAAFKYNKQCSTPLPVCLHPEASRLLTGSRPPDGSSRKGMIFTVIQAWKLYIGSHSATDEWETVGANKLEEKLSAVHLHTEEQIERNLI